MIDFDDAPTLHELTAAIMRRDAERRLWAAKRRATTPRGQAIHVGKSQWSGTVERRTPASYQRASEVQTWLCRGCRTWTMHGAYRTGRCNVCGTARPA